MKRFNHHHHYPHHLYHHHHHHTGKRPYMAIYWYGLCPRDHLDHHHHHQVNEEELLVGLDGEEAPRRMKQEPCMNNLQVIDYNC